MRLVNGLVVVLSAKTGSHTQATQDCPYLSLEERTECVSKCMN